MKAKAFRVTHGGWPVGWMVPCPKCKRCGGDAELRYCWANGGVGWQCRCCAYMVGQWVPRSQLRSIAVEELPAWVDRAELAYSEDARQGKLF